MPSLTGLTWGESRLVYGYERDSERVAGLEHSVHLDLGRPSGHKVAWLLDQSSSACTRLVRPVPSGRSREGKEGREGGGAG